MDLKNKEQGAKLVADVLEIIGGRWRGPIIAKLCDSPRRFNELKTGLNRITSSTLTKELRYLEGLKIVERNIINTSPVAVEYRLSEHGQSISPLIQTIIEWAIKHREVVFTQD